MGRAPAFGGSQQGGLSQPGGPGAQLAPSYGPQQSQAVLDQFESLTLGPAAPGQPGDAGKPQVLMGIIGPAASICLSMPSSSLTCMCLVLRDATATSFCWNLYPLCFSY